MEALPVLASGPAAMTGRPTPILTPGSIFEPPEGSRVSSGSKGARGVCVCHTHTLKAREGGGGGGGFRGATMSLDVEPLSDLALVTDADDHSPDEGLVEDFAVVDTKAVEQLTEGLISHYLPNLQRSKLSLKELTQNQEVLLDTLQQEISKFKECNSVLDINALFSEAKLYYSKLVNIRKEMMVLHEKTSKLKRRALKLQQKRQKEELEREQQREKELEREKQLTAKPAKRT